MAILAAMNIEPLTGPLAVDVEVFPPDNRRRDLDNCLKSLLDALEKAGAYHDDSQIVDLRARKRNVVPAGSVVVTINQVEDNKCHKSQ